MKVRANKQVGRKNRNGKYEADLNNDISTVFWLSTFDFVVRAEEESQIQEELEKMTWG